MAHSTTLIKPIITEKSLQLVRSQHAFTFLVTRTATKAQIKEEIEGLYKVNVQAVNTIVGHKAKKATGRRRLASAVPQVKKALVTLKEGQNIALFDINPEA